MRRDGVGRMGTRRGVRAALVAGCVIACGAALAACRGPAAQAEARAAATAAQPGAPEAPADSMVPRAPRGVAADRFPEPTRPVSAIVAPRWSSEDSRDDAGEAARVIEIAGIRAGARVADIGAGDGYYAVRVADVVGPAGRVWAEDIEPEYLALLQRRLRREPKPNVVLALGEPHDPRLPARSVDVALLIHMYHEITQPFGLLHNLAPSLRPGAKVVILDTTRPTSQHGTPPDLLRCELEAMGYRRERQVTTAPGEYVAVFTAPAAGALTPPAQVRARLDAAGCDAIAVRAANGGAR